MVPNWAGKDYYLLIFNRNPATIKKQMYTGSSLMTNTTLYALSLTTVISVLAGCTPNISPTVYNASQTATVSDVQIGRIVNIRQVTVQADNSHIGEAAGGIAGAAAGSAIGGGTRSNLIGATIGAVAGSVLGHHIEKATRRQSGENITIRMPSERLISIVQGHSDLQVGDCVYVHRGEKTIVTRAHCQT